VPATFKVTNGRTPMSAADLRPMVDP